MQGYYTSKLNGDATARQHVLSPSTLRKHHAVLHAALEHAVQWGLLAANVQAEVAAKLQAWLSGDKESKTATEQQENR